MKEAIHFLNTGQSDCIIIESNKHFAMVDAAEDNDYPPEKPHLKAKGFEQEICDYLIKNCSDENGKVTLDFIVGTHAHSDHLGGFDTIINHPDITVKKAFLKPYHEEGIVPFETKNWDNQEVYDQMKNALLENKVPIIEEFDNFSFDFENLKITLLNGKYKKRKRKTGENENSVVTLIEKNGTRVLLAGDLNYKDGDEKIIANKVGKVDLLKVGHHGLFYSSSFEFISKLKPKYAVITAKAKNIFADVKLKLKNIAHSDIFTTVDNNGVEAILGDNGKIVFESNIM